MNYKHLLTTIVCVATFNGCGQSARYLHDSSGTKATPAGRFALGKADPYQGQEIVDVERTTLAASHLRRRQLAWHTLAKITAPVRPAHGVLPIERWNTWYGRDDYDRMFAHAFTRLTSDARQSRADITRTMADASESHLADQMTLDPNWSDARRAAFLSRLKANEDWTGLAGIGRTLFSPAALTHTMTSYQDVIGCDAGQNCIPKFGVDAVVLKTAWVRSELGFGIPTFDTDGAALSERLSNAGQGWDDADRWSDSISGRAIEQRAQAGGIFQLAGMHIMSKESSDWLWITVWWSDKPNTDFGEDRPEYFANSPWGNYKMCVVTEFTEGARDLEAVRARYPSLAEAIAATDDGSGLSWCSNPYIEKGPGNQKTNCIGCHQHAGDPGIKPEQVVALPAQGRAKTRHDFPADYLWSLTFGAESMRHKMQEQVRYYSTTAR